MEAKDLVRVASQEAQGLAQLSYVGSELGSSCLHSEHLMTELSSQA